MSSIKLFSIAISFLVSCIPFLAQAGTQISPNPNPTGSTINVNTTDSVNTLSFDNYGTVLINNGGLLNNQNTFSNYSSSPASLLQINSGGDLENNGTINTGSGSHIENYGVLNNNSVGTISGNGGMNNYIGSTFNNYGNYSNTDSGFNGINNGTVNNYGTFSIDFGNMSNNGSLINSGNFSFNGNFYNRNKLSNTSQMTIGLLYNQTGGTFDNSGSIYTGGLSNASIMNNSGSLQFSGGSHNGNTGTFNNTGSISGPIASFGNYGIFNNKNSIKGLEFLSNYSVLNNSIGGTISNMTVLANYGTMNNDGTVSVALEFDNYSGATLNNNGTINNSSGTVVFNNYSGATLNNNGAINNSDTFINSGVVTGTGTYIQTSGKTINNGVLTQSAVHIIGGNLSGTGTINSNVTLDSGATINQVNSPGSMTINGNLNSSGTLVFNINGIANGQFDVLNIGGNANFSGGKVVFNFLNGFTFVAGDYWNFLSASNVTGWDTLSFTFNGLSTGLTGAISQLAGGREQLYIEAVPEPKTYDMLLAGLGLIGFIAYRRKNCSSDIPLAA